MAARPPPPALLDLAALDALMRRHGLPRSVDDWQAVHDLLALRFRQGRLPDPARPDAYARLLGPLLCRSPEEQARFPLIVKQWLGQADAPGDTLEFVRRFDAQPWQRWRARLRGHDRRWLAGFALLLSAMVLAWAAVVWWPPAPAPAPPREEPQPAATRPATVPLAAPPKPQIDDRAPPNRLPQYTPLPAEWLARHAALGWAVGLTPWLLVLPWLWRRYVARPKILDSDTPDGDEIVRDLGFAVPAPPIYGGSESAQALNHLGRVAYGETRRLDVAKTVDATARQAGYLVPCYRQRLQRPVFLLLVRIRHLRDHQARLAEELAERFREAGLEIESYRFLDSPETLIPWPLREGGDTGLDKLAERHEQARLIVVSDGRILFHPVTGSPRPWLDALARWPQRAWLGVGEIDHWDTGLLFEKGFQYLPLSSASLAELAAYLTGEPLWAAPTPVKPVPGAGLPASIADYPQRWLKPFPPDAVPLSRLTQDLQGFLDADGWALLQALAAFPRCDWQLSLALDFLYFQGQDEGRAERREARLARLIHLPWLAHAYFPRYLREHWLSQADATQRGKIRQAWEALFERRGGGALPVLAPPFGKLVQDLLRADRAGALGDPIFVQILLGKPVDFWHFRLPQGLAGLFPKGRGRWDLRPALIACLLAGLASWGGAALWRDYGKDGLMAAWQAQIARDNARWPVVIVYRQPAQTLAQALREALARQGFQVGEPDLDSALATDTLGYPSGAEDAARRLAETLRQVGYGVEAKRVPRADGLLFVQLAHTYRPLAGFNDVLAYAGQADCWATPLRVCQDDLQDGGQAPAMVVIPAGSFIMGSPDNEKERFKDEGPQHRVTIARPLALGQYEVTFADYDRYAKAMGKKLPADSGWGRGNRPVINVSWQDAQDYAAWLSRQTGQAYRLPSEAEWEYAARAGTTTAFFTGACINTTQANYNGHYNYNNCGAKTGVHLEKTQPVGSYPANPWGLHDTAGNVWEWVADCWHDNYQDAPADGTAWDEGKNCATGERGVRGGAWSDNPLNLRSANRLRFSPGEANYDLGFRLARAL